MNEKREVFNGGSILIEDDRIKAIGKIDEKLLNSDVEIYDAQGKIILPGLVNDSCTSFTAIRKRNSR